MAAFHREELHAKFLKKIRKYESQKQFLIRVIENARSHMACSCEEEWEEWDRINNGRMTMSEPPLCRFCMGLCDHPAARDLKKIEKKIQRYVGYLEELEDLTD